MRKKIRPYCLIILISLLTIGSASAKNTGLNIESYFDASTPHSVYRMQKAWKTLGGGYRSFIFANWKYKNISYSTNTNNFFPSLPISDIITSNSITLIAENSDKESYTMRGAEITLKEKTPLSTLGYKLITSEDDVKSKYFYILYLISTQKDGSQVPYARMIVYLDRYLELKAELVSLDAIYFISSSYSVLRSTAKTIKTSPIPSLFILEKPNQTVISVTNTMSKQVLWRVDDLSYKDQKAVVLFAGGLNAMKFAVGRSNRLRAEKKYIQDEYTEEDKKQFLIHEEETLRPNQLVNK